MKQYNRNKQWEQLLRLQAATTTGVNFQQDITNEARVDKNYVDTMMDL